jgi:hypothetical protein
MGEVVMEYMEQQAQNALEGGLHDQAYRDGLMRAAEMLRNAAYDYETESAESRKIHASEGARFAAILLRSWANGIEMEANKP